jgi:2,4-dienoyl-CoA reductase-like NADH-dependent reductase (Old Yellow Enzyme family)
MNAGFAELAAPLFQPLEVGSLTLANRLFRSATYEGLATEEGVPQVEALGRMYGVLARGGIGAIITGFTAVSQEGRAMHPGQCGIDTEEKARAWAQVLEVVRGAAPPVPILMQLAHTGRQTRRAVTGRPPVGASSRRCTYFKDSVRTLDDAGIRRIIREFGDAALRARDAGLDGVQLHGAHGYLIHQFLSPWTNRQRDTWGERDRFCLEIVRRIRELCGTRFPVWIKLSGEEDRTPGLTAEDTARTSRRLQDVGADLIEISYGTMEWALNIIRGDCPLDEVLEVNPLLSRIPRPFRPLWKVLAGPLHLRRLKPFTPLYNLSAAMAAKDAVSIPVAVVGGVRTVDQALLCLSGGGLDAVGLCRPLIREPDLPTQWRKGTGTESACTNCNLCTVYCDSGEATKCRSTDRVEMEGRSS